MMKLLRRFFLLSSLLVVIGLFLFESDETSEETASSMSLPL